MTSFAEHRLLRYAKTTDTRRPKAMYIEDPNGGPGTVRRTGTEIRAANQADILQQNSTAPAPSAGYEEPKGTLTPEQIAQQSDPTGGPSMQTNSDGTKSIATNTIETPDYAKPYDAATANKQQSEAKYIKPPSKKMAREKEISGIVITRKIQTGTREDGTPIYSTEVDEGATAKAREDAKNRFATEDATAVTEQNRRLTLSSQAGGKTTVPAPTSGPDFSAFDNQTAQINAMIAADPALAATYVPQMMDLMSRRSKLESSYINDLSAFDSQDQDNDGVSDGVQVAYGEGVEAAERRANEADRINKENRDINLAAANLAKDMATIAQKKFELDQHRTEQLQIEQNIEMERKNRLIANKLGISTGGNGLRWMADEIRKGVETLAYLKEAGNIQEAEFALKIGSEYALNVRSATNGYDAQRLQIDTNFSNDIKNLNSIVTLDAKERRTERRSLTKDYLEAIEKNDEKFASEVKGFRTDLEKRLVDKRTETAKTKNDLWDRLFQQRAQDGNLNPALTQKIIDEMKAAGIDTTGLDANSMTLEQQNEMFRRAKEAEDKANAGRTPIGTMVQNLSDADDAFFLLDKAQTAISEFKGVGGPMAGMTGLGDTDPGWFARLGKFGADVATGIGVPGVSDAMENQRKATATFNMVQQVIGKALEGGVLRKEDEVKYSKMMPNLRDTDEMRTYKLNQLRELMNEGKRALLDNMKRSGYNTSGYNVDGNGQPYDPIGGSAPSTLTNEEVDEIMNKIESGEPLAADTPTGFLNTLALAHAQHEGYGTKNAVSITANNNPGALRWAPGQATYGGVKPGAKKPDGTINDTGFTWFPDVGSGYKALTADLRAKITGGSRHIDYSKNPTILDYVSVYAPAGDRNNPSAYTKAIVAQLKKAGYEVGPDTPLSEVSRYIS